MLGACNGDPGVADDVTWRYSSVLLLRLQYTAALSAAAHTSGPSRQQRPRRHASHPAVFFSRSPIMTRVALRPGHLLVAAAVVCCSSRSLPAQSMRYHWQTGQQFAYEIEIDAESPTAITTYQGIVRYTVDAAGEDQLQVTYRGGLNESSKSKPSTRAGGPPIGRFGPRPFGPSSFPHPFARPTFAGRGQTTNRITLTPRGGVLAMDGDSQLPYLLGNVSLLPFEILPDGDQRQWTADSGIAIAREEDNRRRFGPFGLPGQTQRQSVLAGREVTRYAIQREDAQQIVVKKSYELSSPKTADNPAFEISGEGTWTFDRGQNVPQSLDFAANLAVELENARITIPISIKYRLLSSDELAALDADAQRRKEEREQAAENAARQAAEPLSPEDKQQTLAALQSGDPHRVLETLKQLATKRPRDPDPEVAAALQSLLHDANQRIREDADKTLVHWSAEHKQRVELRNTYNRSAPLTATGRTVTDGTPLYVGQIAQAQTMGSFWFPADILGLLPDGRVMVRGRGPAKREHTLERSKIQLAPDELEQPHQPAAPSTAEALRTWTDQTGQFEIEAVFLAVTDGAVQLRRADGREINVPLEHLSDEDQQYVQQRRAAPTAVNPFD
jgi:hypothetical protein